MEPRRASHPRRTAISANISGEFNEVGSLSSASIFAITAFLDN
jgi:hypothetical protein